MFNLLLERGADATDALSQAVWGAAYDLAVSALEHGAAIDRATANGKPLLNDLIRWGQIPQMTWMLEHQASPNVPDDRGWTAVHQAASRQCANHEGRVGSRRRSHAPRPPGRTPPDITQARR